MRRSIFTTQICSAAHLSGKYIENITLCGAGDPFFSKSYVNFMKNFDSSKFPNLKKLTLENSKKITAAGVQKIESVISLEHLNLVGVALDDTAVNSITKMEGLLEVYLYRTGISEDAINALKASRPRMFVNAG